jgi:lysophospholipase L1-like esterase
MFNCGICGARAGDAHLKNRIYGDCLIYNPKYVVIMFGMNDVEYFCHGSENPEDKAKIQKAFEEYPKNLMAIIDTVKKAGATPIICSPTPYDEYSDKAEIIRKGTDADLVLFTDICKKIADENGLLFIDMRSAIYDKLNEDPIREDRVHPNAHGYHIMAQRFLKAIGAKDANERTTISGKLRPIPASTSPVSDYALFAGRQNQGYVCGKDAKFFKDNAGKELTLSGKVYRIKGWKSFIVVVD